MTECSSRSTQVPGRVCHVNVVKLMLGNISHGRYPAIWNPYCHNFWDHETSVQRYCRGLEALVQARDRIRVFERFDACLVPHLRSSVKFQTLKMNTDIIYVFSVMGQRYPHEGLEYSTCVLSHILWGFNHSQKHRRGSMINQLGEIAHLGWSAWSQPTGWPSFGLQREPGRLRRAVRPATKRWHGLNWSSQNTLC